MRLFLLLGLPAALLRLYGPAPFRWLAIGIGKQFVTPDNVRHVLMIGSVAFVLPYLLLAAHAGYLADRWNRRKLLVILVLIGEIPCLLTAFAPDYQWFLVLRVLMAVSVLCAALAVFHAVSTAVWPVPLALGLYLLTSVGGSLYAAAIQRFVVTPNEQAAETPYMTHNIAATRHAFNLEGVRTRNFSGDAELTREDIDRNADTVTNVRLWDHQQLLATFGQIQELRTYYEFASVDNDRYTINGELRQDSSTSYMIFPVADLISFISRVMTLLPGDVITTGTPQGVGNLQPGDRVDIEIAGIGVLSNPVVGD